MVSSIFKQKNSALPESPRFFSSAVPLDTKKLRQNKCLVSGIALPPSSCEWPRQTPQGGVVLLFPSTYPLVIYPFANWKSWPFRKFGSMIYLFPMVMFQFTNCKYHRLHAITGQATSSECTKLGGKPLLCLPWQSRWSNATAASESCQTRRIQSLR